MTEGGEKEATVEQEQEQEENKDEVSPGSEDLENVGKGSGSLSGGSGKHSIDKLSRSKLQYEADPEDLELRQKLLESKMARKKTEEDAKILMNRLLLLKTEEQKASHLFENSFRPGRK